MKKQNIKFAVISEGKKQPEVINCYNLSITSGVNLDVEIDNEKGRVICITDYSGNWSTNAPTLLFEKSREFVDGKVKITIELVNPIYKFYDINVADADCDEELLKRLLASKEVINYLLCKSNQFGYYATEFLLEELRMSDLQVGNYNRISVEFTVFGSEVTITSAGLVAPPKVELEDICK